MPTRNERTDVAVLLRTEHAVARVLASAPDEDDAHPRLLAAVGEALAWDFGALWTPIGDDVSGPALRAHVGERLHRRRRLRREEPLGDARAGAGPAR